MTNETLAQYANLAVYSAMAVFTLAMIAFALDLAGAAPRLPADAPATRKHQVLVGVEQPVGASARRLALFRRSIIPTSARCMTSALTIS